jgi:hypothetical protein
MKRKRQAAMVFAAVAAAAVAFQLLLAAGAPLGEYAMGGAFPGRFPPVLRAAAVVQAALIAVMAAVILARAGLALASWVRISRPLAWGVVVFSGLSVILNLLTPSARERAIWAPVAAVMFTCSLLVARRKTDASQ